MGIVEVKAKTEKETKKTCYKCKTKLAYVSSDVAQDKDGKYIVCPVCKSFIGVG